MADLTREGVIKLISESSKLNLKGLDLSGLDLEKTKIEFLNSQTNRTVLQKSMEDLKSIMSLNESNAKSQLKIQEQNLKYSKVSIENGGAIILKIFKSKGDLDWEKNH